jgi:hypothetical protein
VNMPPELYEVEEDSTTAGEGKTGNLALFAEDVRSFWADSFQPYADDALDRGSPFDAPRLGPQKSSARFDSYLRG